MEENRGKDVFLERLDSGFGLDAGREQLEPTHLGEEEQST